MKKKITLISLSIFSMILILFNINGKVKADETSQNCETYVNHYFFLAGYEAQYFLDNRLTGDEYVHVTTGKAYPIPIPEGANIISEGKMTINATSTDVSKVSMSLSSYYKYENLASTKGTDGVYQEGNNYYGSYNRNWINEDNEEKPTRNNLPSTFADFKAQTIFPTVNYITAKSVIEEGVTKTQFEIKRTYSSVTDKPKLQTIAARDEGKTIFYAPAIYYVEYQICEDAKYKITVDYIDKNTNKKLSSTKTLKEATDGEKYEYTCPSDIADGYKLYTDDTTNYPVSHNGTLNGKDVELKCYYVEDTHTVTINYGSDEDCTSLLRESTTTTGHKKGEKITASVPTISGQKFTGVGSYSTQITSVPSVNGSNLTFTMPDKNVEVCLVYTPQTGSSWIFIVWIIGGAALAYGIYTFIKNSALETN